MKEDFKEVKTPDRKKSDGIRSIKKCTENPFLKDKPLKIDQAKKQIMVGSTKDILVNSETGETEGLTLLAKYKEVDKTQFVKLFIDEVSYMFELSRAGIRVFSFVLQCLKINNDEIYIHIPDLMKHCNYKQPNQAYKGLAELIKNEIIAMSEKNNLWYINPNVVFNGDRIVFMKEYRIKEKINNKQLSLEMPLGTEFNK